MNRSNTPTRPLNFLFNPAQAVLGKGGQIDWSRVGRRFDTGRWTVKLSALSATNDTTLDVDALVKPLRKGDVIDFGAVETVVVALNGGAAENATSLTVDALTGPIPSGALLSFGVGEQVRVTADAAEGATTLAVEAIGNAIEDNDTATFYGGRRQAVVAADAAVDAVAVTVEPIQFALANDAEGYVDGGGSADGKHIPAGTVMARTSAGKLIPRIDADAETAFEILQSEAIQNSGAAAKTGYGTLIEAYAYENLMPDADATTGLIPSGWKTEMATNGGRFNFRTWGDSRFTD